MRFLSAFFLLAWIGLFATSHAAGVTPDGTPPPPAQPNPPGMVDVTPPGNPDFSDFDLEVFNALPSLAEKLAFINSMREELNRQLGLLNGLNVDSFNRLKSEVETDRKIAKALNVIWLVGNIVITAVLVINPTLGLIGMGAANPLWLQMLLAWVNLANGLVGKAADYFKEKETAALTQILDLVRRVAIDIQQAQLIYNTNVGQQAIITEFMHRVRAILAGRPLPAHAEAQDPTVDPVEADPLLDLQPPPMINVAAPNPDLIDQVGIDAFFNTLSLEQQAAYIATLIATLKGFIQGINALNRDEYDTLINDVKTNRNWSTGLNWGWVLAHGAQTALLQVLPTLTLYNVIPNQQWTGLLTGGLGALGTGLGLWADRFAEAAVTALTSATQSTHDFANRLHQILLAYQTQYDQQHHDTEVASRIRSVTSRPAPPATPPLIPLVPPARDQPNLMALAVVGDVDPGDPTNKGKAEVTIGRQPAAPAPAPKPPKKGRWKNKKTGAIKKVPANTGQPRANDVPMAEVARAVQPPNATAPVDGAPLRIAPMPNLALYSTSSSVPK